MPKRARRPGKYGYLETNSPIFQFMVALGMEHFSQQSRFKEIKKVHKKLCAKYLDLNKKGHVQTDALATIESKLLSLFPQIYSGGERNKRLYFSRRLVLSFHGSKRSQINLKQKRISCVVNRQPTKRSTLSITSPTTHDFSQDMTTHLDDIDPRSKQASSANGRVFPGLRYDSKLTVVPQISELPKAKYKIGDLEDTPISIKEAKIKHSSILSRSRGEEYAFIYDFLGACQPPMQQLISVFLENGCDSEAKLRILAGWSVLDRKSWLRNVSEGEIVGSRVVKGMDIDILDDYIASYFT